MTRWAWVIDQTRCIGCHACTTACKSENEVPVGVFRTWVKNVEVGTFPEVKRHFAVLRCNHCAEPPCVDVCPVTAMYQRPDGLVDFDPEVCIGCKACMQACPYDAIYMDPKSHTAAKCNFCSHRVDEGLLPACVVVCPEEALLFGDLDDPTSKVHRAVREPREQREQKLAVRRPEQGTRPQAYYVGAHPATLDPLAARHDAAYMWSDRGAHDVRELVPLTRREAPKEPARVAYDVPRQRTWGWPVSSYIWTKGIAAGLGILAGLSRFVDFGVGTRVMQAFAPPIAVVFLAITGALLVGDLKRPERFWTILTRPQWKSWLARGAFIITAYGAALVAWIACVLTGAGGALSALGPVLIVLGALTAAYTAWLFAQCEARDLWQTPLLLLHLLLHAVGAGAAALVIVAVASGAPASGALRGILVVGVLATGLIALADSFGRHRTANGAAAARALTRGSQARLFWAALVIGVLLPVPLVFAGTAGAIIAAFLALAGWWLHGHAFVLAGQGPPIS